ncbi:hypothetical protein [Xanthomonas campestris]|uniref:hypothetical protein n=1 Tax=Xanthomonas campestris TaxID=339 RepID=UPI0015F267C6|nr:hypothetical protein [Xanthomonas campestris]MEA9843077.1 hypothetical protein [Xanthomonas campestris pv. raphani]MEA9904663.1 hypothetical protein [Xanthomonas campestris pv. raphani]
MTISSSARGLVLCGLLAAAGTVLAQSATTTRSSNTLQPITTPTPVQPTVAPPRPVQPTPTMTPVPSQLGQRPNAPTIPTIPTIPTRGPAQTPVAPAGSQVPASTPMVYDRNGRLLQGMQPAGPNRVLDTKTGRYYDAVPAGDGMRVVR